MKRVGLLTLALFSPLGSIILLFVARVCYNRSNYLHHLYPGDLASDQIGTPSGELFKMWLALLVALVLIVVFVVAIIQYLRIIRDH